ncbi:MAG TPA: hypothetical protein VK021_02900 [Flavobacteriaceae bacterium]|nr:hypothetical protein [Flavobacteriaceae bacterium]
MIIKDKIELEFNNKLRYYRIPLILAIIGFFCFFSEFYGRQNYSINELNNTSNKIGLTFILIATISFVIKNNDLKFKKIKSNIDKTIFLERLDKLIAKKEWEVHLKNKSEIILKTDRCAAGGRFFLRRSYGEIIYIVIDKNEFYLKSIFDFHKNFEIIISTGENKVNEKSIINIIKSAANN